MATTTYRVIVLSCSGWVYPSAARADYRDLNALVGCDTGTVVRNILDQRSNGNTIDLWIDDEGAINGSEYNPTASAFAGRSIFGRALVVAHTPEGELANLPDSLVESFLY